MEASFMAFKVHCSSAQKPSISHNPQHFNTLLSSAFKVRRQFPLRVDVLKAIKNTSIKLLHPFVDSTFDFIDQPLLPSQRNFAPIDELEEAIVISSIQGEIPDGFPEGVYLRNGPNPLFGGLKSTKSIFGRSRRIWVEGEGMLHALYLVKGAGGNWTVCYNNRYVETETFKLEKQLNRPTFLPAVEGDSSAIVSAYLLNWLRFGQVNKYLSNTNVIEHSGRIYSISETDPPQEIDILTLKTLGEWDFNGAWNRPFTSHPKMAPGTGELVIMGINATKPYVEIGVISADGKKLLHRVDLKLNRCTLSHEIAVTERYNVFLDYALTVDIGRLVRGGQILKYDKEGYARIGVLPRYGKADSIKWFEVKPNCTFHIINSFEDGDEVVVRGCRSLESVIPGPNQGVGQFEWFSRKFRHIQYSTEEGSLDAIPEDELVFPRAYEWRLNMRTGHVKERNLTGTEYTLDFPMINAAFTGVKNKYGYAQVRDCVASSNSGMAKYGGFAKLSFEEPNTNISSRQGQDERLIKEEYHMLKENTFCTGAAFVPKEGGIEEDDGWIITFVHNEDTNISQVYIIDARNFSGDPVVKITLPCRVPYGFHGAYFPIKLQEKLIISNVFSD